MVEGKFSQFINGEPLSLCSDGLVLVQYPIMFFPFLYNTFTESQYQGASLYVPYGCADAYSIASIWELFCDLFELRPDEDAINGIVETLKNDDIYDLSGRKVKKVTVPGIYIKGGKRVMIK